MRGFRSPTGVRRVGLDIATQAFPIAVNFVDRLVLTGLMLRVLGVARFEYWSVALSLAALLSILDFGCLMNFSNMVVKEKELGRIDRSVMVYHQSNMIFFAIGLAAAVSGTVIAIMPGLQEAFGLSAGKYPQQAEAVLIIISLATGIKLATSNMIAVYRANLLFGRGSILTGAADLARIVGTGLGAILGEGLVGAAIGHLAGTIAGIGLIMLDVHNKAPAYTYALEWPRASEMRGVIGKSLAFAAPLIPISLVNQGPVLLLNGRSSLGSGVVAIFVLMRTLSNVARTLIIKVTNVLGMETARLSIRGETAVAHRLLDLLGWQLAVVMGCVGGLTLSMGRIFVQLWTGRTDLFDPVILGMMLAPLVLAPSYLLGVAHLQYRNVPMVWTVGTFVHVLVAIPIYFSLGGYSDLIRVTAAIFGGELLGLAFPVAVALAGVPSAATIAREVLRMAVSVAIVAGSFAFAGWLTSFTGAHTPVALLLAAGVAALPSLALAIFFARPLADLLKRRRA